MHLLQCNRRLSGGENRKEKKDSRTHHSLIWTRVPVIRHWSAPRHCCLPCFSVLEMYDDLHQKRKIKKKKKELLLSILQRDVTGSCEHYCISSPVDGLTGNKGIVDLSVSPPSASQRGFSQSVAIFSTYKHTSLRKPRDCLRTIVMQNKID